MDQKLKYPYLEAVRNASMKQIRFWHKELPSPDGGKEKILLEQKVMELIIQRIKVKK